jgi:hypothetical protein
MKNFLAFVVVLSLSNVAHAIPVQWDLNNIQLWDPGLGLNLLTGSFVYDADSQLVNGVSLAGFPSGGTLSHGFDASGDGSSIYFLESAVTSVAELEAYTGDAMLMTFASSLTNAGGTTNLVNGDIPPDFGGLSKTEYGSCSAFNSCSIIGVYEVGNNNGTVYDGGTLEGSVVPVPAAVWLFGSGLGLLGLFLRRQTV